MKITRTMFKSSSTYSSSQECEQKYELDDLGAYPYAQESITASLMLIGERCALLPGRIS
jgi:hypothetical protein